MKVILPFHDRPNYLRITLATIKEALRERSDIELYLFNDASTIAIPKIAKEIDATIINREKCSGPYRSKTDAIDHIFKSFPEEYVFTLDSDCIVHPNVFSAVNRMIVDLKDMGIGTVFNTNTHKPKSNTSIKTRYIEKNDVGGLGTIVNKNAWLWYKDKTTNVGPKHKGWDWDMCMWLNTQEKWKIYCTKKSYVEHIGQSGSHSGPGCKIDKAMRFLE